MKKAMLVAVLVVLFLPNLMFGYARRDLFASYPNHYFVETGTNEGHGLCEATRGGGFAEYHSIELSELYYNQCRNTFQANPKVHLWFGDSGVVLENVIRNMDKPITFWLDSHFSGGQTARGETGTPLMSELECIKNHPIKNHIIIIDDLRLFGTAEFDFVPLEEVMKKIREINPSYEFILVDGAVPQDILIAKVRK